MFQYLKKELCSIFSPLYGCFIRALSCKFCHVFGIVVASLIVVSSVQASELPYKSIKVKQANIRYGPNIIYPVKFTYHRANIPVQVLRTFEGWSEIKDIDGDVGWINSHFISNNNYAVTAKETLGYKKNFFTRKLSPVARIGYRSLVLSKGCAGDLCNIIITKQKLIVKKEDLLYLNNA